MVFRIESFGRNHRPGLKSTQGETPPNDNDGQGTSDARDLQLFTQQP
jgi:hypothetical protein